MLIRIFSIEFLAALPVGTLSDLINMPCPVYYLTSWKQLLFLYLFATPASFLYIIFHIGVCVQLTVNR